MKPEHKISLGMYVEVLSEKKARRVLDSVKPEQFRQIFADKLADCDYEAVRRHTSEFYNYPPDVHTLIGLFAEHFNWNTILRPLLPFFRQLLSRPHLTYDQLFVSRVGEQVYAGSGRFVLKMLQIAFTPVEQRGEVGKKILRYSLLEREKFEVAELIARLPDLSKLATAEERLTRAVAMMTDSNIDSFFAHITDAHHAGKGSLFHAREELGGGITDAKRCTGQGFMRHWMQGVGLAIKDEIPHILESIKPSGQAR